MILPFVREILAELEHSPAFDRVRRHLGLATGRRRVSGLTATARALYIPLFARAAKEPVIVVLPDNKAAEALELAGFAITTIEARTLPFTFRSRLPSWPWLVSLYLRLRPIWRIFGAQFFIVAQKN